MHYLYKFICIEKCFDWPKELILKERVITLFFQDCVICWLEGWTTTGFVWFLLVNFALNYCKDCWRRYIVRMIKRKHWTSQREILFIYHLHLISNFQFIILCSSSEFLLHLVSLKQENTTDLICSFCWSNNNMWNFIYFYFLNQSIGLFYLHKMRSNIQTLKWLLEKKIV